MAKTSAQIQQQIAALQKEADAIRRKEVPGVIAKIKDAIQHYGLTAADLGFRASASQAAKSPFKAKADGAPKFADDAGNVWSGRGPRPAWLREALAAGKVLSDFATGAAAGAASGSRKTKAGKAIKASKAKYSDGAGKTWSGRGPKPRWVKDALASGKQLADLLAH